jgi:hypothetical protein
MADIFISYAREDREWVEKLANALGTEGYTVWWDFDLLVGKRYRETIETELQTAKAAVVVWSQHSIRSDFVRDEAEDAQQRNILLPLLKEVVRPPAGFRQLQTADLTSWQGTASHAEFRRMLKGVSHLVGRPAAGDVDEHHTDPAAMPVSVTVTPPVTAVPTPIQAASPAGGADPASAPATPKPFGTSPPPPIVAPPVQNTAPPQAQRVPPPPGAAPGPPNAFAGLPPASHPVWRYVAIGVVALFAVIYLIAQFVPGSKPATTGTPTTVATIPAGGAHGGANAGGTAATGGDEGQAGGAHNTGGDTGGGTNNGGTMNISPTDTSALTADVATIVQRAEKADADARARAALALDQQKAAEAAAARVNAGGDSSVGALNGRDGAGNTFTYAGEVADGTEQGAGTAALSNGTHYSGQWYGGVSQGLGVYSYANGDVYSGEFDSNQEFGLGVLTFADKTNGTGYSGQWSANAYSGYGVYYYSNGGRFEGLWHNGQLNGLGAKFDPAGKMTEQGTYENSTLKQ